MLHSRGNLKLIFKIMITLNSPNKPKHDKTFFFPVNTDFQSVKSMNYD